MGEEVEEREFQERYQRLFTRRHNMTVVRDEVLAAIAVVRIAQMLNGLSRASPNDVLRCERVSKTRELENEH